MTSPEERFDDAFDTEIRAARYLNLSCVHCGVKRLNSFEATHVCDMAIADWVWQIPKPHDPVQVERAYRRMSRIQNLTEAQSVSYTEGRQNAEFWNRTF